MGALHTDLVPILTYSWRLAGYEGYAPLDIFAPYLLWICSHTCWVAGVHFILSLVTPVLLCPDWLPSHRQGGVTKGCTPPMLLL
jgi:hypothetical protein